MMVGEGASRQAVSGDTITAGTGPDGRTLTALEARERVTVRTPAQAGTPERVTSATTLVASGDAKRGLTAALFSGSVVFIETTPGARGRAATERRATSEALAMALGGKLDAVDEARFERSVSFKDADVTGDAEMGIYRQAKGQLILQPAQPAQAARRRPHVTTGDSISRPPNSSRSTSSTQ